MSEQKKSFSEMVKASEVPVLVDIYSETCGPCHAMKPVLAEVKSKFGDNLRIVKINGPRNVNFMHQYQIQAFPTLLLFEGGKIVWSRVGFINTRMLTKMIKANAAVA